MRKTKHWLLSFLLICLSAASAFAQNVVSGVVQDSAGTPLPGITYKLKGTKISGATDNTGRFHLTVPATATGGVIEFTGIGFKETAVTIGARSSLTVMLLADARQLSEVVVTGFGESRNKRNLGYAVTQVSGDDIRRASAINPIAALQGMVPGMQVQPGIGGPQSTTRFLIRGSASLLPYGNQPLIVVDDIIMDNDVVLPNKGGDQDFGNILKDLNPDDIESVSVLKGGAVTALYGSRASNGVILIKTKKGFSQRGLGVTFSENLIWDKAYKTVEFQNEFGSGTSTKDFITGPDGMLQINPATYGYNWGPPMTGQTVLDVTGKVIQNNPRPNNVLDVFRLGLTSNANVGVSGGNEKGTFRLSYSNLHSNAITPNNKFDRNSVMFRGTQRLASKVLVDANASYVKSTAYNPANQGGLGVLRNYVYGGTRNYDLDYWMSHYKDSANGGLNTNDPSGLTSVWFALLENKQFQTENNFRGSVDVKATLTSWLEFQANASVNYLGQNYENHQRGQDPQFANPYYQSSIRNVTVSRYRANLNFIKKIDEFNFLLQAGGEINTSSSKYATFKTDGTVLPDIFRLTNSLNRAIVTEDPPNKTQITSAFFQGSVAFRDYLTLNIYGRNDWNSTLVYNDEHGNYSYFYPGADLAWVFTDMFKRTLPKAFDYGKLRLSYVSSGGGTDAYTANTGAYISNGPYVGNSGSATTYHYESTTLPNQTLKPQRSSKFETGLEFKFLHNRLGADITYYTQDSKNQIIPFGVPSTSGVSNALINGGVVRNRGFELYLYGTPIKTKDFSWDTYFNYTRNRNTIVSLPFGLEYVSLSGGDGYEVIAKAGGDYGTMISKYGYAHYQARDANGKPIDNPLNGKRMLAVASVNTSYFVRAANYADGLSQQPVMGSITPDFLGNLRNTFNYKNFQLSVALDAKFGGIQYSTTSDYGQWLGSLKSTLPYRTKALGGVEYTNAAGAAMENGVILDGVYQPNSVVTGLDGQSHNISGMTFKDVYEKGWIRPTSSNSYYQNTHSWANGIREEAMYTSSWVSVQQVYLSYDLPSKIAGKFKFNGLRVALIGNNLFYLHNSAKDGVNPNSLNDSGSGAATESSGMPYIRSYGFSVNASF